MIVNESTLENNELSKGFLYALEIENFKSFKGKHYIGPFRYFSAIIGPNGSGKSNLMDAISFVLGERSGNLRVRKLGDLIHGASVEKAEVNKCRVSMIYVLDKDNENQKKIFTRSVVSSTASEFRIDNEIVTPTQYQRALEKIYIFIKAKNFLVYQGAVEKVAMQSQKELSQLFEELSRSSELKSEYERLKSEMQLAESTAQKNLNKRRDVALEKREAKLEKDEARKYQSLKDDLSSKNKELYLVQLFFVEHSRENAKQQLIELNERADSIRKTKAEYEQNVTEKQQIVKSILHEIQKLEQKIAKEERKFSNQEPKCNQLKQQIEHLKSKRNNVEKNFKVAEKIAEENDFNIKETEKKMKDIQKQKQELEKKIAQKSQKNKLHLNPQQIDEYRHLKSEVEKKCAMASVELDNKRQEQETNRNALEYEKRRLSSFKERVKQKKSEIEREKKNLENLKENEESKKQLLEIENKNLKIFEQEVKLSKERLTNVTLELQDINKQISDAHGDSAESERNRRQNEAIESLKRVFPDKVHGRLIDLCQPSHRKFQISVTKVLGKFMTAIVCDTDETARECITYLREQHFSPETFLPLNSLDVMPLNEKLRDFTTIPNVKLLYDVINCNIPIARKALQFVCGNSLVCDTPDQARQLAFGDKERYRAVSLDGTQFQPNGIISGGGHDLKARAKRWDEQAIKKLRDKKTELQEEYNNLHRTRRRELDVEMKRNQIAQIEQRIKFTQAEYKRIITQVLARLERELEADEAEILDIEPRISFREEEMEKRSNIINQLEKEINNIADQVFKNFCVNVGINHIREYEQRLLQIHEENEQKVNSYNREIQRFQYELDFLRSEDKKGIVKKELEKLEQLNKEQNEATIKYEEECKKLMLIENVLSELKKESINKKNEIEIAESEVTKVRKEGADVDKQLHQIEKNIIQHEQIELRRAQKRHSLLHECKLLGIDIPLRKGSLDYILLTDELNSIDDSQASTSTQNQSQTSLQSQNFNGEDIEVDYSSLKQLSKTLQSELEVKKQVEKLTKNVQEIEASLSRMAIPSTHVNERMELVKEKEAETTEECEAARKKARKARQAFEKVKADRIKRFQEFFQPVSDKIDEIYKALSQNQSAQAFLGANNLEEPYADGIQYNCIAPGKRFRPMDNLSGGEKTIAALALLFAIHSSNPSPFFVLDEIDAALDNTNIGKVVNYIGERSENKLQIIVISLKEEMYNKASALVGVYPKNTVPCIASGILTYNLKNFNE